MSAPSLSQVQQANVHYHSLLAPVYHQQPFLRADNRIRVRRILEDLQRRTSGRRLLDIGCGPGFIFDASYDLFEKLDGVDITGEMLARVESWFPVPDESSLPERLQGLFAKAREQLGFVPNVFRVYAFRPERLSAWFAHYRQLHEPTPGLDAADRGRQVRGQH